MQGKSEADVAAGTVRDLHAVQVLLAPYLNPISQDNV